MIPGSVSYHYVSRQYWLIFFKLDNQWAKTRKIIGQKCVIHINSLSSLHDLHGPTVSEPDFQ